MTIIAFIIVGVAFGVALSIYLDHSCNVCGARTDTTRVLKFSPRGQKYEYRCPNHLTLM